jgi:hypothetical protein
MSYMTSSEAQLSYKTRYKTALFVELLGISPFSSINLEFCPIKNEKSFFTIRAGSGYLPGSKKPNVDGKKDNGISIPVGISYNIILNNLKKQFKYRISMRCNPRPPRISIESFGEIGLGLTYSFTNVTGYKQYTFGIIGIRNQISFGKEYKKHVLFLKTQFNPFYHNNKLTVFTSSGSVSGFGGSIGFSIK